jgi:hypothetical protein
MRFIPLVLPLTLSGCDVLCGGSLDEFCGEHACTLTWEEALLKADDDTGGAAYGCTEGDMLVVHGYLMGRNSYYDGESHDLVAVKQWSDVEEYCGDSSFSQVWGEAPECTAACYYGEEAGDWYGSLPPCEGGE